MAISRQIVGIILVAIFSAVPVLSQTTTGSIAGTVADAQGVAVPGAKVTATSVEKNTSNTATTDGTGLSNAFDANFLRPFPGFGDIAIHGMGDTSNYNSLQVGLNRRFARGLLLGLAYTWSKAMGTTSNDGDWIRIDGRTRLANYGPASFDVRHNFVVNYVYALPGVSSGWGSFDNRVTRAIFNNWQISGLTIFQTGTPYEVGFSFRQSGIGNPQLTGSYTESARINLIGDPTAGTMNDAYHRINPLAYAPPQVGSIGLGAPARNLTNPGINNWDMSLQKNIPLKESLHMELRVDAFNAFNHPQFSQVNTNLQFNSLTDHTLTNLPFNADGTLRDKNGFGTISGVRSPRILELVARIVF